MASGDTLLVFTPLHNEPPASNFATLDTRNQHPVLDFDASSDESAVFSAVMPRNYSGNGVTVYIHYAMTSATTGVLIWDAYFERMNDGFNITGDSFAGKQSVSIPQVPGTAGELDVKSINFYDGAQMDNIAAGEAFRLKLTRDSSDTAPGDAELLKIEIKGK